ncbi:hypothetical protein HK405_006274, partial [Cladochytrium tenue]
MNYVLHSSLETMVVPVRAQDGTEQYRWNGEIDEDAVLQAQGLMLLKVQRELRHQLVQESQERARLLTSHNRSLYKRIVMHAMSTELSKNLDRIEEMQRRERAQLQTQRLRAFNQSVVEHGQSIADFHQAAAAGAQRLGAAVLRLHERAEKEEHKRAQRVAQERMNALKANDEEAYLRLLDQAKDKRITQILQKTSAYLTNLSAAVLTQKEMIGAPDEAGAATDANAADDDPDGGSGRLTARTGSDYYSVAHRIQEVVTEQSSLLVGGQLKEYQIKGLQWMISLYNNRLNGILADEMGLGKTIQTISLVTYLMEKKRQPGPFLVVIPLATMTNWVLEFDKWAPSVRKVVYKGTPAERKALAAEVRRAEFNVLITTYEYIIKEKALLAKVKWVYTIIDEGHRMKNAQSKLSLTLMQYYQSRYRLILTGTPLQNNLPELWAILNFILPKIFDSVKSFDEWFSSPFSSSGGGGGTGAPAAATSASADELNEEERLLMIKELHKVLRPFLLRRLKKDVEAQLPKKVETVVRCPMSALQRRMTEWVKVRKVVGPFGEKGGSRALSNLLMQFRKICNHPFVFPEVEDLFIAAARAAGKDLQYSADLIFRTSGKFELLDRTLPKFFATGHRVLIFFQMTQIMDIAEDYFRYRGWKYLRLDGHIKGDDRSVLLKSFNAENSDIDIFILSTRAGGLGLNLQTADTVIIFDSDWNPHQDLQAQDRAHRIGQTKEVRILRLITTNSVEEHILAKAQQKLDLDGKVIQAGKFDNKTSEKEREELLRLLFDNEKEGAGTEGGEEDDPELTEDQLNEIIARGPDELERFTAMDVERKAAAGARGTGALPRLLGEDELPDVYRDEVTAKPASDTEEREMKPRERKRIRYADNMSDDQWLASLEDGSVDEAADEQPSSSRAARRELKRKRIDDDDEDDGDNDSGTRNGANDDDDNDDDNDDSDFERHRHGRHKSAARAKSPSTGPATPSSGTAAANAAAMAAAAAAAGLTLPRKGKRGRKSKAELAAIAAAAAAVAAANAGSTSADVDHSPVPGTGTSTAAGSASPAKEGEGTPVTKRHRKQQQTQQHPQQAQQRQGDHEAAAPDPLSPGQRAALTAFCNEVLARIRAAVLYSPDGSYHARSYLFEELPQRRLYRDYYSLIKNPIALDTIDKRVRLAAYAAPAAFAADLRLMFANARAYNQEGSEVVEDADEMERILDDALAALAPGGKLPGFSDPPPPPPLQDPQSQPAPAPP